MVIAFTFRYKYLEADVIEVSVLSSTYALQANQENVSINFQR